MTIILNGKDLALKAEEDFKKRVTFDQGNVRYNSCLGYYLSWR
jgi:hypothetical protein